MESSTVKNIAKFFSLPETNGESSQKYEMNMLSSKNNEAFVVVWCSENGRPIIDECGLYLSDASDRTFECLSTFQKDGHTLNVIPCVAGTIGVKNTLILEWLAFNELKGLKTWAFALQTVQGGNVVPLLLRRGKLVIE